MRRRAWLIVALLLLPATVLAKDWKAHKAYDGADPPADQLVHLKVSQETDRRILLSRRGLRISSIDGKTMGNWFEGSSIVDEILFKPGKHRIGYVATKLSNEFAIVHLWFVAEPGRSYASRTESTPYAVRLWIEDVETGARVGGVVGSDDEPNEAQSANDTAVPQSASTTGS